MAKNTHTKHPLYRSWTHIRCCLINKKYRQANHIPDTAETSDLWPDFADFAEQVELMLGTRPGPEYVLNRKDTTQGWNISNLQWQTRRRVAQHQRTAIMIKYKNRTQCLTAWCEELNLSWWVAHRRYRKGFKPRDIFKV